MTTDPDPVRRRTGPPPLSKPPRSALGVRDMLVALAVLVPVILLVAGVSRACTFSPGGPTVDTARLPVVDAPAALRALRVPFTVRIPAVPPTWRANSTDQDRIGGLRVVRVGYLTPDGRYLRLLQSDAAEPALLAVETGAGPVPARGAVEVGGQRWVAYGERTDEAIWITEVPTPGGGPPVRLLITGSGDDAEFRALAGAVVAGEPLPPA